MSNVSDDGITIGTTTTSADTAFAGILATSISSGDATSTSFRDDRGRRNWGWVIVHGPANANVTAGGTSAHSVGDPMITSTDVAKVTTYRNETLPTLGKTILVQAYAAKGYFMDAAVAANTVEEVFVMAE